MYGRNRNELRQAWLDAWRKHRAGLPLEPLERLIAAVILEHPEYHALLDRPDAAMERDYAPEAGETNPFLHMGMHIALHEQIATNRPAGVAAIHQRLSRRAGDAHAAEHRMMDALGETLWEAQRNNAPPDEQRYLERLEQLAG